MVADLLGATLVDAQDELWAAWASLERAGYPEPALEWLTEPPPWPPASVAKYLRRDGETGDVLDPDAGRRARTGAGSARLAAQKLAGTPSDRR